MSIAALIRSMSDAGAPPEAIALAVEAIEAAQAQIESRRATERERKRRQRGRDKDGTVTGQSRDSHGHVPDTPSPLCPPLKSPPDPQKITPPISPHPEPPTPEKSNGKSPPAVTAEQVVEAWNTMADGAGVPKARLTDERRRKLRTFVRRHTIDDITEAIWAVPRSPFLCGENDRGWKAGIDFILQPSSFTKLIEGTYDRATH